MEVARAGPWRASAGSGGGCRADAVPDFPICNQS